MAPAARPTARRGRADRAAAASLLAAAALLAALAAPAAALLTPAEQQQWAAYARGMRAAAPGGARGAAAGPLVNVFSYDFSTPLEAIQSSNVYTGGNSRVRRVVSDLLSGRPIKVVAIGGLATNGSDASSPGRNDYFALYANYLSRAFPGATIKPARASAGLAPSAVVAGCSSRFIPDDADLVILEMTANDGLVMDSSIVNPTQPKAYEILVRKILNGANAPALLLAQTMPAGMGNATRPFYMTPESPQYAAISGYYDIPYVSMRNALWPSGRLTTSGLMSTPAVLASDGATPEDAGHAAIADSLVFFTQRTAQDLQVLPFGDWDTKAIAADVPSKGMFGGIDSPDAVLRAAACSWVRNASVSTTGGCPSGVDQLCGLDFSSWAAIRAGYAKNVKEIFSDDDGPSKTAALVGGIVGGVLGGLALVAAGIAFCVVRHKRRAAAEEAAYQAKYGAPAGALPITASSGAAAY